MRNSSQHSIDMPSDVDFNVKSTPLISSRSRWQGIVLGVEQAARDGAYHPEDRPSTTALLLDRARRTGNGAVTAGKGPPRRSRDSYRFQVRD